MSTQLANFLRCIPQSNQDAEHIQQLSQGLDPNFLSGYATMLQTIGVIQLDEYGYIKATSQTAKYMLESMASYVEANVSFVQDWQTRGVNRDETNNPLQNGATLLHALDYQRSHLLTDAKPSRTEKVAQVLIKRNNPQTEKAELLLQFDANADQYQFIGGRYRASDGHPFNTLIREIEEELVDDLHHARDYEVKLMAENLATPMILSPTFGALTEYYFWFYHMVGLKQPLQLAPDDLWVPVEQILAGYVLQPDGSRCFFKDGSLYHAIDAAILGGLEGLPTSFQNDTISR